MKVYLVGGAERDMILGIPVHDKDYAVEGATQEDMLAAGYTQVGNDFPVFLHPMTGCEYALTRVERKDGVGYQGFSFSTENVSIVDDLRRRDLTINSMAIDSNDVLVDPYGGALDIKNKVLRHTSEAFREDPLRVLRVARFAAKFGPEWTIHPSTASLMHSIIVDGELRTLTKERVWLETEKALSTKYPSIYFRILRGTGLFTELDELYDIPQPSAHHPEVEQPPFYPWQED